MDDASCTGRGVSGTELGDASAIKLGMRSWPMGAPPDLLDATCIDPVAGKLACRFLVDDDGDAFELLTRLVSRWLSAKAHASTRRDGLAVPPAVLVAEFMTAVFLEGEGSWRRKSSGGDSWRSPRPA
jgi:hypothetical protein